MIGLGRPVLAAMFLLVATSASRSQPVSTFGPFNVDFPQGGDGYARALPGSGWRAGGGTRWSLYGWVEPRDNNARPVLVGGIGGPGAASYLAVAPGRVGFWNGSRFVQAPAPTSSSRGWRFLAAVADGVRVHLYVDGTEVGTATPGPAFVPTELRLAPLAVAGFAPFGGRLMGFTLDRRAMSANEIRNLAAARHDPALAVFDTGSPTWPVQVTNATGLLAPQDAWTLPRAKAPFDKPVAIPAYDGPALVAAAGGWTLPKWRLAAKAEVAADGAALSRPGYDAARWYAATVPGTVLTTLVDRGVYPDPGHGLNNMAIPDGLGRQEWWYRTEFTAPVTRHPVLVFDGINYAAEVWLNGARLGNVRGAFIRGRFDVAGRLRAGANAVAVRISPPPHPGIAHEESIRAGAGFNGGMQALDGPTFFASEGWDWIPGIRDRNIGLWQGVRLEDSGAVRIGDPQIVTTLPGGDTRQAVVELDIPLQNTGARTVAAEVSAGFDDVSLRIPVQVPPGGITIRPKVLVANPKLWWPNGYGAPALHTAHFAVRADGAESDHKDVRFGMRQITYELSLMDSGGHLRRVEVDYAHARALGQRVTDGRHEAVRRSAGTMADATTPGIVPRGWVNSLTAEGEHSPAVRDLADTRLTPFLILKVNGVRIAARGGSWGTDDMMKRISREHLEPYFRLHREAGVNIIRNWMGQNTEPVFYDLADEYGLLITNDFWDSTENYQMEPADVPLFLANAADTIARYRNHPSIALWFGRNEGMPPPPLNEGLQNLVYGLDGTRWYNGSSNEVSLWFSGPYNYREPAEYFTTHAKGFSVEVGTPSFPTLEAFEAIVPPADRWPMSDTWAYHDWHQDGNGDTHGFVAAMDAKLGVATSLEDFERKAQLMNYETHRAIIEGMNAGLWREASGRMLWMTQPAWGSTMWQILSHDYDTHASYYGFKHAAEPVHAQMTLPDHRLQLVNNTDAAVAGRLSARVVALDGRALGAFGGEVRAEAGQVADGATLDLAALLTREGAVVVAVDAVDAGGAALSHNVYWVARDAAGSRRLNTMAAQPIKLTATIYGGGLEPIARRGGPEEHVQAVVTNMGTIPALNVKLTLTGEDGARILPAYYSDNYLQLLPGETRKVDIAYPRAAPATKVAIRGWNAQPAVAGMTIVVASAR